MSSIIKNARRATVALKQDVTVAGDVQYQLQCVMGVVIDLASRIDRASGSPSFKAAESDALTELMDAWRVAEPAAVRGNVARTNDEVREFLA